MGSNSSINAPSQRNRVSCSFLNVSMSLPLALKPRSSSQCRTVEARPRRHLMSACTFS